MPHTPPTITDELPMALVDSYLLSDEGMHVLALDAAVDTLRRLSDQDIIVTLFNTQASTSIYARLHSVDPEVLMLEVLDRTEFPDDYADSPLQGLVRLGDNQLQFETRFLGYSEGSSTSLLVRMLAPSTCAYIQRRNAYRLNLLPLGSASCFAQVNGDEVEISVADVSLGGIGLLGVVPGLDLQPGLQLNGVRIELAIGCCVVADLEVRSQADYFLRNGIKTIRTGTCFAQLSPANLQLLTHFIHRTSSGVILAT